MMRTESTRNGPGSGVAARTEVLTTIKSNTVAARYLAQVRMLSLLPFGLNTGVRAHEVENHTLVPENDVIN